MQANGGDCMRACVASLFNVALADVPDLSDHGWQTELREWARPRGYGFVTIECPNEDVFRDSFSDGFLIVAGQSARDRLHAVIYKDGKLWHDPHPASTGIDRVRQVDFFYPLLPNAPRSERGTSEPVAWRYRYGSAGMEWRYVDRREDVNPSPDYEVQPLYGRPE